MKNAIRWAPSAACFSLLLLGCEREDRLLAPQIHALASTAALTCVQEDPVGDAFISDNNKPAPPWLDIVQAGITKDGRFVFTAKMAGDIPETPELAPGTKLLDWSWALDTDQGTFPAGFPFGSGFSKAPEYIVQILWDGTDFMAQLIDRTPLLTGGEAVVTELAFSIKGAELSTSVKAALIGNPSSFKWISLTRRWPSHLGTGAELPFDSAPEVPVACPS